jgi:serine/threonine-protein kinase RsbW
MLGPPCLFERRFDDLGRVVDEVHALFDAWIADDAFAGVVGDFGLCVMKLAVHEWIANLIQHAAFSGRTPEIAFAVYDEGDALRCVIEDNSDGFDFQAQLHQQAEAVHGREPGERGRGLLMMIACTKDLAYETAEEGRQRLAFVIRSPIEPESLAALCPAADGGALADGFPDVTEPAS